MNLCEHEFNKKALELIKISESLHDSWKINEKDEKFFLSKKKTISIKSMQPTDTDSNDDPAVVIQELFDHVIPVEYHVLFHPSYQVPVLYFNAYSDGALISMDDVSKIFVNEFESESCHEMQNVITQAEHPILFKPFFMVHPCMVNKILDGFPRSKNFILTFLTLFGPSVQLHMSPDYDKFYAAQ